MIKNLGTYFRPVRITNQRQLNSSKEYTDWEAIMDAKWNKIIDKLTVRTALLLVGFGAWLAIGYGLLSL